jgi:hypothetical protein
MQPTRASIILLALCAAFFTGCGLFQEQDNPEVDLTEIFPSELPTVGQAQRLNVDGEGIKEWLVFFHVDVVAGDEDGSPVIAAVYWPVSDDDKRVPPHLVPALLWQPSLGYLCLHTCEADMEDVISAGPKGEELVIRDKLDENTVGVSIFRWKGDQTTAMESEEELAIGRFEPLGHFRGDSVEVERDKVIVIHRHYDRSDLAAKETYQPENGRYYTQAVRDVDDPSDELYAPQEAEIIFAPGPPAEPADVELPEKLVLAFYQNFRDLNEIARYFDQEAWTRMGRRCPANRCGCASRHEDVSRVMVKQIAYEADLTKITQVAVQVVCINGNGEPDPISTVTWSVRREPDSTWVLFDVVPGGESYVYPRSGCCPLRAAYG